jgi:hypothetical protein
MRHKPSSPPVFRAHGQFSSRVDGRLIFSSVTGPWNKELVQEWAVSSHALVKSVGPHVGIALIQESMLCTPEALQVLRHSAQYAAKSLHCIAHAMVADKSIDGRDLVDASFLRAYEGVIPFAIFYTVDEARAWGLALLAAKGY